MSRGDISGRTAVGIGATDDTFPAGAYGLAMYRAAAMYDDLFAFEP